MIPDLKQFRLNTMQEVKNYKASGGETFVEYYAAMKSFLDKLPYGGTFDICKNIPAKNWEKFIKTACVYMVEQAFDEVRFSNDYLFIERRKVF